MKFDIRVVNPSKPKKKPKCALRGLRRSEFSEGQAVNTDAMQNDDVNKKWVDKNRTKVSEIVERKKCYRAMAILIEA